MGNTGEQFIRNCVNLTPEQADAIFFPGPGGKVNKARAFCDDCPFKAQCLLDAIDYDLEGFFAGSTKEERKEMAKFRQGVVLELTAVIDSLLPKSVVERNNGRRVKKRVLATSPDPYRYLDEIEPTIDELITLT